MAVDPSYRGRGVGEALMHWGLARADELGLESLVEATTAGRWLYEKVGYRYLLTLNIDPDKKNAGPVWRAHAHMFGNATNLAMMWRPKNGDWSGPQTPWDAMVAEAQSGGNARATP